VQELVAEKQSTINYAPELGAYFEYSENVVVTVFYDDYRTLLEKLHLYRARGIDSVSFWRIGLGPPQLWSSIDAAEPGDIPAASGSDAEPPS
jgi:spore germination protein YaaH